MLSDQAISHKLQEHGFSVLEIHIVEEFSRVGEISRLQMVKKYGWASIISLLWRILSIVFFEIVVILQMIQMDEFFISWLLMVPVIILVGMYFSTNFTFRFRLFRFYRSVRKDLM